MTTQITIEFFSASICNRCVEAKKRIQTVLAEFDQSRISYREVDVVEELDYAVSSGVLTTPTIIINGDLVFSSMPSIKQLRIELEKYLTK